MLERILTSLEISKKLHDLNVTEKSVFCWEYYNDEVYALKYYPYAVVPDLHNNYKLYTAYGASDLLTMLPHNLVSSEPEPFNSYRLYITGSFIVKGNPVIKDLSEVKPTRIHIVNYKGDTYDLNETPLVNDKYLTKNMWDENPADALDKMLIYLIENKFIELSNG